MIILYETIECLLKISHRAPRLLDMLHLQRYRVNLVMLVAASDTIISTTQKPRARLIYSTGDTNSSPGCWVTRSAMVWYY